MAQWLLNTAIVAALQTPFFIALGLHYDVLRRHNFALGGAYAAALCITVALTRSLQSIWIALPIALAIVCLLLVLLELAVFRPLDRLGRSADEVLIASLGVNIVLEQVLSGVFGDAIRFSPAAPDQADWLQHWMTASPTQFAMVAGALAIVSAYVLLRRTETGLRLTALGDNRLLFRAVGLSPETWGIVALIVVGALVTASSVAAVNITGAYPSAGFNLVILGFVARLVGGPLNSVRFLIAAIAISVFDQAAAALMPNQWRTMLLFAVLFGLIAMRARFKVWSD